MAVDIVNNRWSVGPDQFAVRIMIPDLNGFFQRLPNLPKGRTLIIEPGTRALVIDNGYVAAQLRGGAYTFESFTERLQFWQNRQVTVFLAREEDIPLEMWVADAPCLDSVCFSIRYRWTIQIQEVGRFLDNLLGGAERDLHH